MKTPWYEITKDDHGMWSWCLWSANGRPMCTSDTYQSLNDCKQSIRNMYEMMAKAGDTLPPIRVQSDHLPSKLKPAN